MSIKNEVYVQKGNIIMNGLFMYNQLINKINDYTTKKNEILESNDNSKDIKLKKLKDSLIEYFDDVKKEYNKVSNKLDDMDRYKYDHLFNHTLPEILRD